MQTEFSDRLVLWTRRLCIFALLVSAVGYIVFTVRWPWMWDEQVFHYDVFLMKHGKVAYRDFYDMNLPGYLLLERWAIAIFGGGDVGWRIYEYVLLTVLTLSCIVIARPYDWLAGLFAGVTFAVLHGGDGAGMAVERDEVVAVFLMAVFALLCIALRRGRASPMLGGGFLLGMAILMKPTVATFAVLFAVLLYAGARARGRDAKRYGLLGVAGLIIAGAVVLAFLLPGSLRPFLSLESKALNYYSGLGQPDWGYLFEQTLPLSCIALWVVALEAALWNREIDQWDIWGVRGCMALGAISYFVQRKGYTYHRYPLLVFVLLWVGIEFCRAMKSDRPRKVCGGLALGLAVLVIVLPGVNFLRHSRHDSNPLADELQADLVRLGGNQLQGKVQCLDLVTGCFSALDRLGLVQSTGWMGDLGFFGPNDHNVVPYFRQRFWDDLHRDPPKVIVLSSEWFGAQEYSFDKLNAWPEFRDYLNSAYTLDVTRHFRPFHGRLAYRIYIRKQ